MEAVGRISRAAGRFCKLYGQRRLKAGEEPQGFHRVARMVGSSQGMGCLCFAVSHQTQKQGEKVKNIKKVIFGGIIESLR